MTNSTIFSRLAARWSAIDRSLLLVPVGALLALQPLFQGRIAWLADGWLHFYRLAQLDRALRHGALYPRWLPDMGFGFGFPLFNYYAPLGYYAAEPLRLAGLGVSAALLVSFALALVVGGVGVYLWVRDLFGRPAGLVAALAAIYAPYTLYNVFHRGALAEVWGLAWVPLVLWALRRLSVHGRPLDLLLTALTYAALVLSHNILALICSPLLAGYALFLWLLCGRNAPFSSKNNWRRGWLLAGALALGLGLSAFFWGPAFFEKDLVQIHQLYAPGDLDYRNNFASLGDLAAAPMPVDPALINPPTPRSLGWPQLVLALGALLTLRRWPGREARAHLALLALTTLGLALMTLPISTPVWDRLPLLRFVQFPWRFLGPAGLTLAALAGAGAVRLPGSPRQRQFWPNVAMLAIVLFSLTWLFPNPYPSPPDPTPVDLIRFEKETGALGTTSAGDYLPIGVVQLPPPDTLLPAYQAAAPDYIIPRFDETSLPAGATVIQADYGYNLTTADLTFDTPAGFTARFNWYFFPGWQAKLDGAPHPLRPEGPHGLVAADIPPGRHQLTIAFGHTPLRRWASLISCASLVLLLGLGARRGGLAVLGQNKLLSASFGRPYTFLFVLVTLTLFALKSGYLDNHDTPFRRSRFDGRQVAGAQVPLQVNFGAQMVLMGYDLGSGQVRADGVLELALYWRAQSPLDTDYSIAVHLVDDQGWRYGQKDSQHPACYPTSRWQANEYARDLHRLAVWPATPPGAYILAIGVYDVHTGRQLDLLDANGAPAGAIYNLAQVQVTRPTRPPRVDDLELAQTLVTDLGEGLTVLGLNLGPSVQVNAGERLPLTLYWRADSAPDADYLARLRLVSDGAPFAQESVTLVTSAWQEGDVVRDNRSPLVPAATLDGDYVLRLDLLDTNGRSVGPAVDLTTVTVHAPERTFDPPHPQYPLAADSSFGPAKAGPLAALLGYDLSAATLAPGQTLQVTLYWQAQATAGTSYTIFVHLLDAAERIYAQHDQTPAAGGRPTTGWVAGEIIRDIYTLTLAPDAPPGRYRLEVGLYEPRSGDRLPLLDINGRVVDTRILLPTVIQVE